MAGLFKSFFRRSADAVPSPGRSGEPGDQPAVRNIVVPQRAVDVSLEEPAALVQAVIDFVNRMADEGCFNPEELPRAAMQAYHVDFWVAQVENGGLAQFLHNSGRDGPTFENIEIGLEAMGLEAHARVFSELRAWADEHLDSDGRDGELDAIQARFFEAGGLEVTHPAAAAWLRSLHELRPVDDDQFAETMRAAQHLNPKLHERLLGRRIGQIQGHLLSTVPQALRMAALACEPSEFVVQGGPGQAEEIDGRAVRVWTCRTNAGLRGAVLSERGVELYAYEEHAAAPGRPAPLGETGEQAKQRAAEELPTSVDALMEEMMEYRPPTLGDKLSFVSRVEIERAREYFQQHKVAAAIDLLMRRGHPELTVHSTNGTLVLDDEGEEKGVFWVFCGEALLTMSVGADGAVLVSNDPGHGEGVVKATRTQIEDHARRADIPWHLAPPR